LEREAELPLDPIYRGLKLVHLTLTAKVLNINAFSFQEWTDILLEQLELVEKINPRYIIIHATSKESKLFSEEEQIKNICINLRYLQAFFKKPIFIENTFEDLSFYENLFEKADKKLNFVFDIGHKKVHSKKSNESWILFLKGLREKGRKIHFHIHDNNGIYDLHKTLSFYKNEETIAFVKELMEIFPEFNFILESHSANFENIRCDYDLLTN
jgi:uncharacterized protein (UPF0276 family)